MKTLITQTTFLITLITVVFSLLGKMDWSMFFSISIVAVILLSLVKLYSHFNQLKDNA